MNLRAILRNSVDLQGNRALRHGLLAGIAVFLLLVGSSASYAYWKATAAVSGTASTATVLLTADGSASAPLSSPHRPGEGKTSPVTIANTGDVSLDYTASISPTAGWTLNPSSVQVAVWMVTSAASCTAASPVGPGVWTGTLAGFTVGPTGTLAAGVSQVLCVRTTLASSVTHAQQGQAVAATITFTGSNGWTSSAAVSVSPSVYTVPVVVFPKDFCSTDPSQKNMTLHWQSAGPGVSYRLEFSPAASPEVIHDTAGLSATFDSQSFTHVPGPASITFSTVDANGWVSQDVVVHIQMANIGNSKKLICA